MEENPKKRGGASVAILLTMVLLVYPLSSGPAIMVLGATGGATGPHPAAAFAFKAVYAPLALLVSVSPKACDDACERWLLYWDRYGVF